MAYNLYPLASESGRDIPLDVHGVVEAWTYTVTNVAMSATNPVVGLTGALLEVQCPEDVILSFSAIPVVYAADSVYADSVIIKANTPKIIQALTDEWSAALITGTSAILSINKLISWDKLITEAQRAYG